MNELKIVQSSNNLYKAGRYQHKIIKVINPLYLQFVRELRSLPKQLSVVRTPIISFHVSSERLTNRLFSIEFIPQVKLVHHAFSCRYYLQWIKSFCLGVDLRVRGAVSIFILLLFFFSILKYSNFADRVNSKINTHSTTKTITFLSFFWRTKCVKSKNLAHIRSCIIIGLHWK